MLYVGVDAHSKTSWITVMNEKGKILKRFYERKGDNMIKSLGIIIGGIFIGAVGMEIIHKKCPKAMDKFYKKAGKVASGTKEVCREAKEVCREAKEAFKAGYENVTQPQKATAPSS